MTDGNPLLSLSDALAAAVTKAGQATVLVNGRRRMPASGIVYAPGLILTADHVLERDEDIRLILPDGEEASASLAGRDPGSDLALLRMEASGLSAAEVATAEAQVGQLVLAVGRPSPAGVQASLGIITSTGGPLRTRRGALLERYLTTDAVPYPGFSGGPLVDAAGRILALNTSGLARGASLGIPIQRAWAIASTLSEHGRVRQGYLGIRSQPVTLPVQGQKALGREQTLGLLLLHVEEDSPAAQGDLMIGDILVGIGGEPLEDPDELTGRLTGSLVGKPAQIELLRGGQVATLDVIIGERK
jgi:S1-C subfamily serine protease